jgi:Holliday junction resolvase RusA-like endonuclease
MGDDVLSGVEVLRTIIPDPTPVPLTMPTLTTRLRWPDKLIVRFGVGGHPCQWVTFGTGKRHDSKRTQRIAMREWQTRVAQAGMLAMREAGRPIHGGPCGVWIDAVFAPGGNPPDRDNIAKSTVDALQGVVYIDDYQVIAGETRRMVGKWEGAVIEVWTATPHVLG